MKTNKYQWMKDLHLMTFVCLDILCLLIFVFLCNIPISILSVCHNHHISFLLDPVIHENEGKRNQIMFLIRIHYDDGNTVLFISVADWSCIWAYFMYLCILALYLHSSSFLLFCEAIFHQKEMLYSMVNYYWSLHATLHWLNWVLNCKSIIILMEVFRCRTKRTGYDHKQLLKLYWIECKMKCLPPDGALRVLEIR